MVEYKVINVRAEHIQRGIDAYGGKKDNHLNKLLVNAGFQYTAYRFRDNRILLVLPENLAAFLYQNEEHLYQMLDFE